MEEIVNTIIELAELEGCHRIVKPLENLKILLAQQELLIAEQTKLVNMLLDNY